MASGHKGAIWARTMRSIFLTVGGGGDSRVGNGGSGHVSTGVGDGDGGGGDSHVGNGGSGHVNIGFGGGEGGGGDGGGSVGDGTDNAYPGDYGDALKSRFIRVSN